MNQSAKDRFPTLDKATDRIAELEKQLQVAPQKTQNQPAAAPQRTFKQITLEIDQANARGDTAGKERLYAELRKRRGY
jgi:hypothetical protein